MIQPHPITAEMFFRTCGDQPCELIGGSVVTLTLHSGEHGRIAGNLLGILGYAVRKTQTGTAYANTGFILRRDPDTVRAADAAFIHRDRQRSAADHRRFLPGAPDLAVEVVSPEDSRREVHEKALDWLSAGTLLVWVIWPDTRQATVYRSDADPVTLNAEQELDGGDLLPGFRCRIADIFE